MKRSKSRLPALITAIALQGLVALPAAAQAADYYVDQGSIGGKCSDTLAASSVTASKPWCTPAKAIAAAPEGATVLLRSGTYSNITALNVNRSQMLTLKPAPRETVTLAGAATTALEARAVYLKGSRNLRFEGFKITGGVYVWNSSLVQLVRNDLSVIGVDFRNISDGLVERNSFHDYKGSMRALSTAGNTGESGAVRFVVRANEFQRIEHDAVALYWRLQDVTVEDNYIHNIHRPAGSSLHPDALQIAPQASGAWGQIIVRRNRIVDFDQGILVKDGTTRGLILENNVIGGGGFFQAFVFDAPGARITNNTVAGRLYLRAATTNATVTNNVLGAYAIEATSGVAQGGYNLVDRTQYNPGYTPAATDKAGKATYVDTTTSNYRLAATSLGIDVGSSSFGAPVIDVVKMPRPSGGIHDLGAYELQAR